MVYLPNFKVHAKKNRNKKYIFNVSLLYVCILWFEYNSCFFLLSFTILFCFITECLVRVALAKLFHSFILFRFWDSLSSFLLLQNLLKILDVFCYWFIFIDILLFAQIDSIICSVLTGSSVAISLHNILQIDEKRNCQCEYLMKYQDYV